MSLQTGNRAVGASRPPSASSNATLSTAPWPRQHSASESSDDGLHLTPAEVRRFARRDLRRSNPTPDLVTSLVRPPSPEALYMAPQFYERVRQDIRARMEHHPNRYVDGLTMEDERMRRPGPSLNPHPSSLDIPGRCGGTHIFDMYSLAYVDETDPNLLCPICHDPIVDPVTTPCDHTFCYRCLRRCITSSPSGSACPIDREPLLWLNCSPAARLIRTQLNGLMVKCPNHVRGCTRQLRRELVEGHAKSECSFGEFFCLVKGCGKRMVKNPTSEDCPHPNVKCKFCSETVVQLDLGAHLLECPKGKTRCEACWQLVVRCEKQMHYDIDCEGIEVGCIYQELGCPAKSMRGQLGFHLLGCPFHPDTPSGAVIRSQKEIIRAHSDVLQQLKDLEARQNETSKQLSEISSGGNRGGDGAAVTDDKRTIQDLDAGFEEMHQSLTHLEARQSMWTINQVMPIREEVTELRNNINMVRMHVNWLLNRSREEGRLRAANNGGSTTTLRRESTTDVIPLLPERRRSSGTEADLPRL